MSTSTFNMSSQIKNVYCWNANSIRNKFDEISIALNENDIDILAINETKIDEMEEYFYKNEKFYCMFKSRNRHGGGVAFCIRKEIDFCLINDLENLILNVFALKLKLTIKKFT